MPRTDDECERCDGRGWYPDPQGDPSEWDYGCDFKEKYCDCPSGQRLRERDR